jgi:phage terminase large subunit
VFIAQRVIYDMLKGGRNYLIARAVARTVRRSVFNELHKIISAWSLTSLFDTNKSDGIITCQNGYQILFAGLDDVEKIKSITPAKGVITDIWVEEATETSSDNIKQLYKRQRGGSDDIPKRMILSFNPIMRSHSLYQEYFAPLGWSEDQTQYTSDTLTILKTTYKDNKFLTDSDIDDLENETDSYFYNVYTLGNWGVLGDVIFTNWEVQDLSAMDNQFTNHRHGLDFGFSSDPAAMPCTHYDGKNNTIYVYNELYERGLTNDMLANEVRALIGSNYVKCDSAEPKSITELNSFGVSAIGAKKGKDSVNFGIDWLRRQRIIVDSRCVNMQNELQQYQWKKDKDGNSMKVPIDKHNHLIDALRYAYEDEALGGGVFIW